MTARRVIVPGAMPSRDANGRNLPAKLRFYEVGTTLTTPATVYSNEALTVAHDFPVLSDAAGRWPPIWADDAKTFDVAWSDQTFDRRIGTFENLSPAADAVLASAALAEAAADSAAATLSRALAVPAGVAPPVADPASLLAGGGWLKFNGSEIIGASPPPGPPGGNVMSTGPFSALSTQSIPADANRVATDGHVTSGIGSATYVDAGDEVLPDWGEGVWWSTTANGRRFRLSENIVSPEQFGAIPGADASNALEDFFKYLALNRVQGLLRGQYTFSRTISPGGRITLACGPNSALVASSAGQWTEGLDGEGNGIGLGVLFDTSSMRGSAFTGVFHITSNAASYLADTVAMYPADGSTEEELAFQSLTVAKVGVAFFQPDSNPRTHVIARWTCGFLFIDRCGRAFTFNGQGASDDAVFGCIRLNRCQEGSYLNRSDLVSQNLFIRGGDFDYPATATATAGGYTATITGTPLEVGKAYGIRDAGEDGTIYVGVVQSMVGTTATFDEAIQSSVAGAAVGEALGGLEVDICNVSGGTLFFEGLFNPCPLIVRKATNPSFAHLRLSTGAVGAKRGNAIILRPSATSELGRSAALKLSVANDDAISAAVKNLKSFIFLPTDHYAKRQVDIQLPRTWEEYEAQDLTPVRWGEPYTPGLTNDLDFEDQVRVRDPKGVRLATFDEPGLLYDENFSRKLVLTLNSGVGATLLPASHLLDDRILEVTAFHESGVSATGGSWLVSSHDGRRQIRQLAATDATLTLSGRDLILTQSSGFPRDMLVLLRYAEPAGKRNLLRDPTFATPALWLQDGSADGWSLSGGAVAAGGGNDNVWTSVVLMPGATYRALMEVTAASAGTVRSRFWGGSASGESGALRSSTGIWVDELVAADHTRFGLLKSSDFVGTIASLSLVRLS